MPYKLQNSRYLYGLKKKTLACFAIKHLQFKRAYLFENRFILLKPRRFSTRRVWIKQRSSLVNSTIVTKLQFICINQNLFTSADEEWCYLGLLKTNIVNTI